MFPWRFGPGGGAVLIYLPCRPFSLQSFLLFLPKIKGGAWAPRAPPLHPPLLLYWYRNSRLREATLELLRCRKRPTVHTASRIRQRRYSEASLDVENLQNKQRGARLLKLESVGAMMCLDTFRQRRNDAVKERSLSAPSRVASDQIFTQQRGQLIVTVQIENTPV